MKSRDGAMRPREATARCSRAPPATVALLALSCALLYTTSLLLPRSPSSSLTTPTPLRKSPTTPPRCPDLTMGEWIRDTEHPRKPLYDASCPFHRNAWNCLRNGRENMGSINSWAWAPAGCGGSPVPWVDPAAFLAAMRGRRIGFIGDSLNENFVVAFLCTLRAADPGARKWKRRAAWRGGYFPKYDVTVAYHRAVLLANYTWQPMEHPTTIDQDGRKGFYKVDVDVPANDWANVTKFYNVLVFNTGHWWGLDKFPKETPLVFYREGKPIVPPLGILGGLQVVLDSMISYIDREVPEETLKFWRTQSPRHFYGGEWDHNGSCLFTEPLKKEEEQRGKQGSKRSELSDPTSIARHKDRIAQLDLSE